MTILINEYLDVEGVVKSLPKNRPVAILHWAETTDSVAEILAEIKERRNVDDLDSIVDIIEFEGDPMYDLVESYGY